MNFLHISDLHLGLRLYEASLIDDQRYILEEIKKICEEKQVRALVIAGDIYDKGIPAAEAVELFDEFLSYLMKKGIAVLSVAGNHDSGRRISFGREIMEKSGIYMEGTYKGTIKKAVFEDEYGKINFYLLPFIKPASVREYFPDADTFDKAVKAVIENENINTEERNIMVSHQFVTGKGIDVERSESETIYVGGVENVDASAYRAFDYTALGHIHKRQNIGKTIVYSGTPLKYSFSEASQTKTAVLVEIKEKGNINIENIPLKPMRDMRRVEGFLKDIEENAADRDDYIYAVLKDENILNAMEKMREIYPNTLRLEFWQEKKITAEEERESLKGLGFGELFERFFERQNGTKPNENEKNAAYEIYKKIGGENNETS